MQETGGGRLLHRTRSQFGLIGRSLGLVWKVSPGLTTAWLATLVMQGLLPAVTVYLTRALVNSIVAAIETSGNRTEVQLALLLALFMGLLLAAIELLRGMSGWIRTALSERVRDNIADLVHEQSLAIDLAFYDIPDYYDRLHRATQEASYRPVTLLENLGSLLQNSITMVAMVLVLIPYGIWLPLLLLLGTLPALFLVFRIAQDRHELRQRTTTDERHVYYYNHLITAREAAPEVRLLDLGPQLRRTYQALRQKLRSEQMNLARREGLTELAVGLLALITVGLTMLFATWQVLQGVLTLGDLALIYQAFTQGQRLLRTLLQSASQAYGNSLFLADLFAFLELKPNIADPADPEAPNEASPSGVAVHFDNVSFQYPNSNRFAIRNLDLVVPEGKTLAIVGDNGAGKSTLVKLLCRFYDPADGHVFLFDQDIRFLRQQDVHRRLSVYFQTPLYFNMTVADNIAVAEREEAIDLDRVKEASYLAGASELINRLPQGYDTVLGVWFGQGTDLSVGEWRRVSLARALFREASLFILDEPTSAMDPWAEAEWIRRFRAFAVGKTSIIITHRFTTAMVADIICVMENGTIVESGSHAELLAKGGRYAQSWREFS